MKRFVTLTTLTAMTLLFVIPSAQARGKRGMHEDGIFGPRACERIVSDEMVEQLKMTEDQRTEIEAIIDAYQGKADTLRQTMRTEREELRELWTVDGVTRDEIQDKVAEVNELRGVLMAMRADQWFDIYEVLTPAQVQTLNEIRADRREMREERRAERRQRRMNRADRGLR